MLTKKLVGFLPAVMFLLAGVSHAAGPVDVPHVSDIIVDGDFSDWDGDGFRVGIANPIQGYTRNTGDFNLEYRLAWDERGVLIAARVMDDEICETQSLSNLQQGDSMQYWMGAGGESDNYCRFVISTGVDPTHPDHRWRAWDRRIDKTRDLSITCAAKKTSDGYDMEVLMPWSNLGISPKAGDVIGFQMDAADVDSEKSRCRLVWNPDGILDDPNDNQDVFYSLRLSDRASPAALAVAVETELPYSKKVKILVRTAPELVGSTAVVGKKSAKIEMTPQGWGAAVIEAPAVGVAVVDVDGKAAAVAAEPCFTDILKPADLKFDKMFFTGSEFPRCGFGNPDMARIILGDYSVRITYYNSDLAEVTSAEEPGWYGAVVEITPESGRVIHRYKTLYRKPEGFMWHRGLLVTDRQNWVELKRKLYGSDMEYPDPFICPMPKKGEPAAVVHEGTLQEAGMKPDAAENIDKVLSEWSANSDEGFAVVVIRHGVIVIHEAYGMRGGEPMTVDTNSWMASISKLMASNMITMLVDQGVVDLDEPIDKYLPAMRGIKTKKPLTIRNLYTHTGGFREMDHWGDDMPDMDEIAAEGYSNLKVGQTFAYNGVGIAIGDKIIESVSGESALMFFRNHLLMPLGCRHTGGIDVYQLRSTPLDMAKILQMMMNGGAYGDMRFYSEETLSKMMPERLTKVLGPETEKVLGMCMMYYTGDGFGEGTFGHGAASSAIIRVDPGNDLIVVMTRDARGENYDKYLPMFFEAVLDGIDRED